MPEMLESATHLVYKKSVSGHTNFSKQGPFFGSTFAVIERERSRLEALLIN
jgi:hypothetical protein